MICPHEEESDLLIYSNDSTQRTYAKAKKSLRRLGNREFTVCGLVMGVFLLTSLMFTSLRGHSQPGVVKMAAFDGLHLSSNPTDLTSQQSQVEKFSRAWATYSFSGHGGSRDIDCAGWMALYAPDGINTQPHYHHQWGSITGNKALRAWCDQFTSSITHFANQVESVQAIKFDTWHVAIKYYWFFNYKGTPSAHPVVAHLIFDNNLLIIKSVDYLYTSTRQQETASRIIDIVQQFPSMCNGDCDAFVKLFSLSAVAHEPPAFFGGKNHTITGREELKKLCLETSPIVSYFHVDKAVAQKCGGSTHEDWSAMVQFSGVTQDTLLKVISFLDFNHRNEITTYYNFFTI
eukprot:gb/GEZN01007245.1/.p1 GENE.gb/GEZN01007245.1/~~gb/GEZN01007245.1/.p1  ORF type:complete len:346 (+),score=41.68 gb/GEZN01007245.1/:65-1102(+)